MDRKEHYNVDNYICFAVCSFSYKEVWLEDIKKDYDNLSLLKESSLQNAFYFHLRRRLGEDFLAENNLKIYPEFKIGGNRADLAVVAIDPNSTEEYLKECVTEVISVIEMKYKGQYAGESNFDNDVLKVLSYIDEKTYDTMYYLAFIREVYFHPDEVTNWISDEQALETRGSLTEMYSYGDRENNHMIWGIKEY
ncbi:hypothetical protein V8V54_07720 [Priestia megaterium]|uniref:hypothetical protein n=1 Tax=Priestia megaterium TaxID=1404 RepID=UPI00203C68F0|nr:hypothetical protein [Priestia megaterium]MCM3152241.1 hypothetical protein [Priestia megaterium]